MTTKEAFQYILDNPELVEKLGLNQSTARSLRRRFKHGKVTIDKMEELIAAAGGVVKQEKQWKLNITK